MSLEEIAKSLTHIRICLIKAHNRLMLDCPMVPEIKDISHAIDKLDDLTCHVKSLGLQKNNEKSL